MNLEMRWVGEGELDRVTLTRARCYGAASNELPRFRQRMADDPRAQVGDYLLATDAGVDVGTLTSYRLAMWVRGGRVPCQGIGWVGTIKTHRRGARTAGEGIASRIMREGLRIGRERGDVVSALMPFRGSFYEHFGYGVVERMCTWTLPLAVLPSGAFDGVRFLDAADLPALAACRQRQVQRGQCDIERSAAGWEHYLKRWEDGWVAVDVGEDGSISGYLAFQHVQKQEKDYLAVTEAGYDDIAFLRRLLHFIASLRDQYAFATLTLPADLPLNRLLREVQIPHRLVNHAHAEVRPFTRMAIRVLDHRRFIESMHLPLHGSAKIVVSVRETEGHESRFAIDLDAGRASIATSEASPDVVCTDRNWAAIVCGDVTFDTAAALGLATTETTLEKAAAALRAFGEGPLPFCQEYF